MFAVSVLVQSQKVKEYCTYIKMTRKQAVPERKWQTRWEKT